MGGVKGPVIVQVGGRGGGGEGRRVEEKEGALNYFDLERPKGKLEGVFFNKNKKLSISIFW